MKRVVSFLIAVALIGGMVSCGPGVSEGLEIRTWYDLDAVRDNLNGDHTLMNDLDSTTAGYTELASPTANEGQGWQPIGNNENRFTGTFNGQGYEIRDLFIKRSEENSVGLFGRVDEKGVIKDVRVVNADVTGNDRVGGLVGISSGTVSNSYSSGNVTGDEDIGGLVGVNSGTVSDSYSSSSANGYSYVGGLLGANWYEATVSNACCSGNVNGYQYVGGLVGMNHVSTISNSYSTGNVTGHELFGGLVGYNWFGSVSNSYYNYNEVLINGDSIITIGALFDEDFDQWLADDKFLDIDERLSQENGYYTVNDVNDFKELLAFGQDGSLKFRLANDLDLGSDPNFYVPYLAGEFDGNGHKISNLSFNFAFVSQVGLFGYLASDGTVYEVTVENVNITACDDVGGLVGHNDRGTVSNSYFSGNVTGYDSVGGLVGIVNGEAGNTGSVGNSDSSGNIIGEYNVGGLVGYNYGGTVSNSYSTGSVTGGYYVGGLVGWNEGFAGVIQGTLINSYSTGNVTGGYNVGGLVGWNEDTVSNAFWDIETSGQSTSAGGTGKNTTEMQDMATFSGAGWDIIAVDNLNNRNTDYVWNIVDDETYPFLSWQPV